MFSLTRLVFDFANSGNANKESIWNCINSIINGECSEKVTDQTEE